MIIPSKGNLLKADVEALINTVNTVGVMGKGIALQFKQAFPKNFTEYQRACKKNEVIPGKMFTVSVSMIENPKYIINFPTKRHWRQKSKIEDIRQGLEDLRNVIIDNNIKSIAVPPLGCGNGGLEWSEVKPLIYNALKDLDCNIHLYGPSGAPKTDEVVVNTTRPNMTKARALLLLIMAEYLKPGYKLSLLEIQKLAYFLQELGEPLKLRYEKNKYGPYADNLNHVLIRMEGHFIRGYGDRSSDAEIYIMDESLEEAKNIVEKDIESKERIKKLQELIFGFETPYGMELLSTVHWIVKENHEMWNSPDEVVKTLQDWNKRKKTLFKESQIIKTLNYLNRNRELFNN